MKNRRRAHSTNFLEKIFQFIYIIILLSVFLVILKFSGIIPKFNFEYTDSDDLDIDNYMVVDLNTGKN